MVTMLQRSSWNSDATEAPGITDNARSRSHDETTTDIWSSMLDGVASGKDLPKKTILLLGRSGWVAQDQWRSQLRSSNHM